MLAALVAAGAVVVPARAEVVPTPSLSHIDYGAGIRHRPFNHYPYGAGLKGYSEEEYEISGTTSAGVPYASRIMVRRPVDPKRFNGVVIAEWHNVTAGRDLDVDFMWAHDFAMERGYAYLGVSAQAVGVGYLKGWDPVRYANLVHPGDDPGSFDIFAQAIQALRQPGEVNPLNGLTVEQVIAVGQSQSAIRLVSYINNDRLVNNGMVDGFVIHSAGGAIRDDNGVAKPPVPVFQLMADGEASGGQQDSQTYRLWEEAGTAHTDADNSAYGEANRSIEGLHLLGDVCAAAGITLNTVHRKFILNAALHHLTPWITKGTLPPSLPRWDRDSGGALVKDQHGNTVGGVRLPDMDVPVATHSHDGCAGGLAGSSVPLPEDTLDELYPTHDTYVSKFRAATTKAVKAGSLLPGDAARLNTEADARYVGADLP